MKKLITITFAFIFSTSIAFAQNDATITQTGSNADATINQTGSNEATINQATSGITQFVSTINQIGEDNKATTNLTASGSMTHKGVSTAQTQEGDNNNATIEANGSPGMNVTQYQKGDANEAIAVAKHNADVKQEQIGNNNYAEADLVGKGVHTTQIQEGNENSATMYSGKSSVGVTYQEQIGDNNSSDILSFASRGSARSYVDTYQEGDFNTATVEVNAVGNNADIDQIGNMNEILITFGSEFNTATVHQNGNSNTATITQY